VEAPALGRRHNHSHSVPVARMTMVTGALTLK